MIMSYNVSQMRKNLDVTRSWEKMEYTGWQDENLSWKDDCYIGDWSQMTEVRVTGPEALKFFSDYAVNSFEKFAIRQAKHVIFCNIDGKIIGEGILIRFGEDDYEFQSGGLAWSWLEFNGKKDKDKYNIAVKKNDDRFKYQVSGPKSLYLLENLTGKSLRDIKFMHMGQAQINGVDVDLLRQGMAGEVGFEIQGPKEKGKAVYDAVFAAGKEFNIRRIGARTAMVNHMEACFPTVVHDYLPAITGEAERDYWNAYNVKDNAGLGSLERFLKVRGSFEADDINAWYRSPMELGWGARVSFNHEFYGRAALEKEAANPKRKIVTLVWNIEDVTEVYVSLFRDEVPYDFMELPRQQWYCNHADKVMDGDKVIGIATNRCYSFYFREMISHCSIDIAYATLGTEVSVVWGDPGSRQKIIRATVAQSPYKTDNRYADLTTFPEKLK
jgi:vanillate/3-O-methylgallate O-demethylase